MNLKEQKQELIDSMINIGGMKNNQKLKAILHNTGISIKLDKIEHIEKQAQSVREFLFELAIEKGLTKNQFRKKKYGIITRC